MLRDRIDAYFKAENIPFAMRYFDPNYLIRSVPASAEDAILCDSFARNAVHAALAGKTAKVRFEITVDKAHARHFGFAAEARNP